MPGRGLNNIALAAQRLDMLPDTRSRDAQALAQLLPGDEALRGRPQKAQQLTFHLVSGMNVNHFSSLS
jgi:hypothetical protein